MTIVLWLRGFIVGLGLLLTTAIAVCVASIDKYDALSFGGHASGIRKALPWRISRVAAALPIITAALARVLPDNPFAMVGVVLLSLLLAEVYSVCLHRESYIAAFEPWEIPYSAKPLGQLPYRPADRRLQYMIRIHSQYVFCLAVAGVIAHFNIVSAAVVLLFVAKFVPPAWIDYEAYYHWDMHTRILRMRHGLRVEQLWRLISEVVLSPAVGSLPWFYSTEHLLVHHRANGGPSDVNSVSGLDRTSPTVFAAFQVRTIWRLASTLHVIRRPQCNRLARAKLAGGFVIYWGIAALALTFAPVLSIWLLLAVLYRGHNTAKAQYIWHGLQSSVSHNPTATTTLWVPPHRPTLVGCDVVEMAESVDGPQPDGEWGYFDNYHLLHHLHPRAHFLDYPRLIAEDDERIRSAAAAVLSLEGYESFFDNLMLVRLATVLEVFVEPKLSPSGLAGRLGMNLPQKGLNRLAGDWPRKVFEAPIGYLLTGVWLAWSERRSIVATLETSA